MPAPYRVCFVCTGNICRSPMAESVFRHRVDAAGLRGFVEVDSAGTQGWHEGDAADSRAIAALRSRGYDCAHAARRFERSWFASRDLVIALDAGHLSLLRRLAPDAEAAQRVRLLRSFAPGGGTGDLEVPDPYYGSAADFEHCLNLVEAACEGLLDHVTEALAPR
jgi:protein-tyrosine phosphatase